MKKLKLLAVMVITVATLFTVAFAADVAIDAPAYNGTDDTYTVTLKATKEMDVAYYSCVALQYNENAFSIPAEITSEATSADTSALFTYEAPNYVSYTVNTATGYTFAKDATIMAITFTVKDKNAAIGSAFTVADQGVASDFYGASGYYEIDGVTATVTAAQQKVDPVIASRTEGYKTVAGAEKNYLNVWVGEYNVTLNDNTLTGASLKFAGRTDAFPLSDLDGVYGGGTVGFNVAIVGVPTTEAAPTVTLTWE